MRGVKGRLYGNIKANWMKKLNIKKKPMVNHRPGCSMLPSAILQSLYKLQPGVQGCSCSSTNLPIGEQWTSSKERIIYCDNELFSWRDVSNNQRSYILVAIENALKYYDFFLPWKGIFCLFECSLNLWKVCKKSVRSPSSHQFILSHTHIHTHLYFQPHCV